VVVLRAYILGTVRAPPFPRQRWLIIVEVEFREALRVAQPPSFFCSPNEELSSACA
jgi:hypothetical protein